MKIPKRFKVHGHTYTVKSSELLNDNTDAVGSLNYRKHEIILQKNNDGFQRPNSEIEHAFLHELTHLILDQMCEHEMKKDEKFVEVFSSLLHQAITTMEYK